MIKKLQNSQILIEVIPYDENWPSLFEEEARKVRQIFGQKCVAIYHIGSTSVPGLAAKPMIDMMVVVKDVFQAGEYSAAMKKRGYEDRGLCSFNFDYLFKKDAPYPPCIVHVFGEGSSEIDFHLRFRDYLRTHADAKDAYAALKLNLAQKHPYDIYSYCLGKSRFFREIHAKARFEKIEIKLLEERWNDTRK